MRSFYSSWRLTAVPWAMLLLVSTIVVGGTDFDSYAGVDVVAPSSQRDDANAVCFAVLQEVDVNHDGSLSMIELESFVRALQVQCDGKGEATASLWQEELQSLLAMTCAKESSACNRTTTPSALLYLLLHDSDRSTFQVVCSFLERLLKRFSSCGDEFSARRSDGKDSSSHAAHPWQPIANTTRLAEQEEEQQQRRRSLQSNSQCHDLARIADINGNSRLTQAEYLTFVEYMTNCPGSVSSSPFLFPELYTSAQCLCDDLTNFCCNDFVEIRSSNTAYWDQICSSVRNLGPIFGVGNGCTFPTAQPTRAPIAPPTPAPTPRAVLPAPFAACIQDLRDADADSNNALDFAEFSFLQSCSGNAIVNPSVFSREANSGSSTIDVGAAYWARGWTEAQQADLLRICNLDACEAAPELGLCESQLLTADANEDGELSRDEYYFYLDLVAECRSIPDLIRIPVYETARCACADFFGDLFCCLLGNSVDISMLDPNGSSLGRNEQAYIDHVCTISSGILFAVNGEPVCPPTRSPTRSPTFMPTRNPTPAPTPQLIGPPPPVSLAPTPEPTPEPTPFIDADPQCVSSLIQADVDNNEQLDSDEYTVFVAILSGCGAVQPQTSVDLGFRSTICASCSLVATPLTCCATSNTIDLSPLLDNPDSFLGLSYAALVCGSNAVATQIFAEEVGCPTASPTASPVPPPTLLPSAQPVTNDPTFNPTISPTGAPVPDPTPQPTPRPVVAPTNDPTRSPTPRPVPPPTGAPVPPPTGAPRPPPTPPPVRPIIIPNLDLILDPKLLTLQDCAANMVLANTIRPDRVVNEEDLYFLNEEEYLAFLRRESDCSLIRSLSDVQREAFLELACICERNPGRFTIDCCEGGNANVDIAGAQKLEPNRSPAERAALQNICDVTQSVLPSVCAPPPTPSPTRSPPLPAPAPQPVTMPVRVTAPEIPSGQSAPAPMVPQPTIPPVIEESESCRQSLRTADSDGDAMLDIEEFLDFVRKFSVCNYIDGLTFRQISVFMDLACGCSGDPADLCCSLNPKVPLADEGWGNSVPAGYANYRARICTEITPVLESTCIAPTPELLVSPEDLRACTNALSRTDDGDEILDREEFLEFIRRFSGCDIVSKFDFEVVSTFYAMSCTAARLSGESEARCLSAPMVNISGVALSASERSTAQTKSLSELCASSTAIIDRECAPFAVPTPIPEGDGCINALIEADTDGDNGLNKDEFFRFLQNRTEVCSQLQEPTAAQKLVFAILSCSCIFETKTLLCCLSGAARIRLDAAKKNEADRQPQDTVYLSIACRASEVTAFSCETRTLQQLPTSSSVPRGTAWYVVVATAAMVTASLLHL